MGTARRRRTDRLYIRSLGPRERESLALVQERPGITVEELADALGVTMNRMWGMLGRLEVSGVRRERS
jgi:hypothetical protein